MSSKQKLWAELVKAKLKEKRWTQTMLAETVGYSKVAIHELLKYGKGSDELIKKVAEAVGIDEPW